MTLSIIRTIGNCYSRTDIVDVCSYASSAADERNEEQHDKDKEQYLGDGGRASGDAEETEGSRDDRDD